MEYVMHVDLVNKLLPTLWEITQKCRCTANVSTLEDKLTVNILFGKRRKTFCDKDENIILQQLKEYLDYKSPKITSISGRIDIVNDVSFC